LHGKSAVEYEKSYIDIALCLKKKWTFFEIKTALTVKSCIREAMGQLLEYGHYANQNLAKKLVVVGDAKPSCDDALYLKNLRDRYQLPVFYSQWRWDSMKLDDEI
jgi:hypothetical protein